jgi:hypothetical protein
MNKIITVLFIIFTLTLFTHSQEKKDTLGWRKNGFIGVSLSQVAFSNWAAGGESSIAGTGFFNITAKYIERRQYWNNSLDLAYGLIKSGENENIRKNDDKIELNSDYGRYAFGKFYYSAQTNFRTQFSPGYNYPNDSTVISRFMAPGYLTVAAGLNWKPVKYFSLFFSPATGKFTFVLDQRLADIGAYGVDSAVYDAGGNKIEEGKQLRGEFGASMNAVFEKELFKNVAFATRLQLFNNYTDKNSDNRKNIDVNWKTGLIMTVNDFLNVAIATELIYDHDIPVPLYEKINGVKTQVGTGPRTQFKEALVLNIGYKF